MLLSFSSDYCISELAYIQVLMYDNFIHKVELIMIISDPAWVSGSSGNTYHVELMMMGPVGQCFTTPLLPEESTSLIISYQGMYLLDISTR